ncbi:MAG TPA: aldehyde dehydrogenase EutE [Candidatus Paceibacterota bacterium]|nr:aldehyde dehydrogenase EutE [Verrucomicrobiota bacterium]HSA09856.1 aldehyde dehydrogenase EutE [Candidatus Paceibacterota bacterium]
MSGLSDQEIEAIAQHIVADLTGGGGGGGARPDRSAGLSLAGELGIFDGIDQAVRAARDAFVQFDDMGLQKRNAVIAAMRDAMREHGQALAREAHEETGLGRYEDKILKNQLVTEKTPGTEDLQPQAITGDHGLNLTEPAPYGVIAAITPTTNPTSTIINNAIGMIAAGNAVVFNVHPNARRVSCHNVALLNKAILAAGGPRNLITCIANPTVESAQALMKHPGIRLVVVTGGGGVVKAAMESGKRAICAGPGNPPVVVDETADIDKAARDIVFGASFDNNIICADEKECLVVSSVADKLIQGMIYNGAALVWKDQLPALEKVIFKKTRGPRKEAEIDRSLIGKNASVILQKAGITCDESVRLGIVEVDHDHPLLWTEQMMPILPVTRVRDADEGIDLAIALEHPRRHTFVMHSDNLSHLSRMARECDASIFVKNGPSQAGLGWKGEGPTSFTIASPTGEGMTSARSFSRWRRCTLVGAFRIV